MENYPITESLEAIKQLRQTISWKPGKASTHLYKRIRLGHLPSEATLEQYESIFPPDNPESYLANSSFINIGFLQYFES